MKIIKKIDNEYWAIVIDTSGRIDLCDLCEWGAEHGRCGVVRQICGHIPCYDSMMTLVEYAHAYLVRYDKRGDGKKD